MADPAKVVNLHLAVSKRDHGRHQAIDLHDHVARGILRHCEVGAAGRKQRLIREKT